MSTVQLFAWFSNNVFGPLCQYCRLLLVSCAHLMFIVYWLQNVLAQLPDWTIKVFSTLGELGELWDPFIFSTVEGYW